MKKIIAFLLAAIMLLGMGACRALSTDSQENYADGMKVETGLAHSDYQGVSVRIKNAAWSENGFVLEVDWINKTSYEGIFGASYIIERKEEDGWVSCQTVDELVFIALAYVLSPGQTREETYHVSSIFDVSGPGTYRFRSELSIGDKDHQTVWAEFTLGKESDGKEIKTQEPVEYGVQYIRTDGYQAGEAFPKAEIIRSVEELNRYYEANKDTYYLERRKGVSSDTTIGFLDACDKYDAVYFEKDYLVFVLLEEGSGSVRHAVTDTTVSSDGALAVYINTITPEVGTCDMAQWHIILEMSRNVMPESTADVAVYLDGELTYSDGKVVPPKTEGAYKKPPQGTVITPEGESDLRLGGYSWVCSMGNGLENATIADQAGRPLPKASLDPVSIGSRYGETVYAPVPGGDAYAPTNSFGYLVKLNWETAPSSVTYTCWPDAVWKKGDTPEERVIFHLDSAFYAKPGGYIYEIVAVWEDTGAGFHGTANYYVYIIGGNEVS